MEKISKNSVHFLQAFGLKEKKNRDAQNAYLLEGEKLIAEAFRHGQTVQKLFVCEKTASKFHSAACPVFELPEHLLNKLCDTQTPQGVVAQLLKPPMAGLPGRRILVLDGVQDPGNLGSILRIAAATGVEDVYLHDCADAYNPKVLRSAMSGHFLVQLRSIGIDGLSALCRQFCFCCADSAGESVFSAAVPENFALALGNEGNGVSAPVRALCEKVLSIPMKNGMESLNVAAAAAVLLYQLCR